MSNYDLHELESGLVLKYVKQSRFNFTEFENLSQIRYGARLNILSSIKAAGSGHIGTSFSSIDVILASYFYLQSRVSSNKSQNDIFFTSKGHDAPALYAALHIKGDVSDGDLFKLRRLNGLPGHPEIGIQGVHTNTGSLGMGISKAKGFVKANRLKQTNSRVIVLLGDGELQEGQIWESLATAARDQMGELVVIVDGNKIQSDSWVSLINPYEDLRMRVNGSGWNYEECDGHNISEIINLLKKSENQNSPTFIYANTVKGSGVSVFEEFPEDGEFYKFHSGSISDELYEYASSELIQKFSTNVYSTARKESAIFEISEIEPYFPKQRPRSLITEWSEYLNEVMSQDQRIVILDADLSYDTGTYKARINFPERYIQCGISEQDMVSMAGTLALSGYVPLVHSFATFLTMRPTEQIFNNATEETSIVYLGFLAGLIPSPPGFSHQAVNDVAIMNAIPGMEILEPACPGELRDSFQHAISKKNSPTYLRIGSVGLAKEYDRDLTIGNLNIRKKGTDTLIITSGPMLALEAIDAAIILENKGLEICVATAPQINFELSGEVLSFIESYSHIFVLENFGSSFSNFTKLNGLNLQSTRVIRIGMEGIPKNGWNDEVLKFHKLDAKSISDLIANYV